MEQTINAVDYQINYYGNLSEIKPTSKVLALFIQGSGFGDGGADYYGSYTYYLYQADKFGKVLNKVGEGHTNINGYDVSCSFTLNGQKTTLQGIPLDNIFTAIFKREK